MPISGGSVWARSSVGQRLHVVPAVAVRGLWRYGTLHGRRRQALADVGHVFGAPETDETAASLSHGSADHR